MPLSKVTLFWSNMANPAIRDKVVCVKKIHTDAQIADIFTKPLFGEKLRLFTAQMLGHLPRVHEDGSTINMDYQPLMENMKREVCIKPAYQKILKNLPP